MLLWVLRNLGCYRYLLQQGDVGYLENCANLRSLPANLYLYIACAFYLGLASGTMAAVF